MIHGLWTGYEIVILDEMDYGPDLDKDSDPSGPSAYAYSTHNLIVLLLYHIRIVHTLS